jgi:KDO2-lipid IV(A) lauroyltransferase
MFNVEFLYINKLIKKGELPPINNIERIQGALKSGKGVLMGTLHFSNWDIAGIAIAGNFLGKTPVWAIADDLGGGYSRFVQESRKAYGINIVLPNKNLKDAYKCLRSNGILNVLVDRPVDPSKENAVEVDFFGKKTFVATAAARLALACGSKIIIGTASRSKNGFSGEPGEVLQFELTGDEQKDIKNVTQAIMNEAEKIIMENPEQWYMFRDFWHSQKSQYQVPGTKYQIKGQK